MKTTTRLQILAAAARLLAAAFLSTASQASPTSQSTKKGFDIALN